MATLPAFAGRDVVVYVGDSSTGTVICARTKSFTFSSEAIDVTSDCDDGVRTQLDKPAQESFDTSIEGVLLNDGPIQDAFNRTGFQQLYTFVFPGLGELEATCSRTSFESANPYNEAGTFTMALQSSGAWTYTPEV